MENADRRAEPELQLASAVCQMGQGPLLQRNPYVVRRAMT